MVDFRVTAQSVAHRGDPYHYRENTLASVRSALVKGADVVEVDVRITRDGVPVLLHDATLERLWGSRARVSSLTAAEVSRLTGGGVPTLAAALEELGGHPAARLLLDLTETEDAGPSIAAVREAGPAAGQVYYCGSLPAMVAVRVHDPAAEIAMTWTTSQRPPESLVADLAPRWINLRFGLIDPPLVLWARDHGLLIGAWTPDTPRAMSRLVHLGVDAITSNRLETLQRVLAGGGR
ncbi:glycerophosphodiester phosphodiesterase [Streptomyces polygonati]|uniref:Glycerophosphodiester phosphodiesterase n=1 Tax=Streptomyces polygonati TaxID=1617087 RepID=A0ABV8HI60_9ACTN